MKRRKKKSVLIQTGIARLNKYLQSREGIRDAVIRELEICRLESHRPSPPSEETFNKIKSLYGVSKSRIA